MDVLFALSLIPALVLISDGYRVGNVKKGVRQFFLFAFFAGICIALLVLAGLEFVFSIPVLIIIGILVGRKKIRR
ncbi:MAG: hypothetical protein Aureis2KO_23780 [Aureisphaera sp.]